jgi:hypothetical protein
MRKKARKRMSEFLPSEAFRAELLDLLAEQVLRHNAGQSSSVRVETAEQIFESMLYCIRAYLESRQNSSETGAHPQTEELTQEGDFPVRELYRRGLELVKRETLCAKAIYREVLKTRVKTGQLAYNVTLDGAIPGFFKTYDPDYAAHENGALTGFPDYPLLRDDRSRGGILYMKAYLEELLLENRFCARYPANRIRALLFVHGQKHGLDYREVIVNIPELILERENAPKPYVVD